MANKKRGTLEREMLASMREWTPERRREYLTRCDELDRTLRYIERRDKTIAPELFALQAEADSLALITNSAEPTAEAGEEATQDLTTALNR